MNNLLQKFDSLLNQIVEISKPALLVKVEDAASSNEALMVVKHVKALKNAIEERRKEIVGPLNAQVKSINEYAKNLSENLLKAETHIKSELIKFERELEAQRLEALKMLEAEQAALREAETALSNDLNMNRLFGVEQTPEMDHALAIQHEQAEDLKLAKENILENKVKGARKVWTYQIIDESLVPRKYLMLDPRTIRADIASGVREISGLNIFQDIQMSIRGD